MKLRAPHSLVGSQIGFKETQRYSVLPNRNTPVDIRRVLSTRVPTRACENEDQIIPCIADLGAERVVIDSWNDLTKGWCATSPQAAPRRLTKPANAGDGERKQDNRGGTYRVRLLRRKVQRDIDR